MLEKKNDTLVIFDMDGTILDTITDITNSINYTFNHYKLGTVSQTKVKAALGNGGARLVNDLLPNQKIKNIDEIIAFYLAYYTENNNTYTKPYKGIVEVLEQLKPNYKLAVVSNKSDHLVKVLNEDLFKGLFDIAIGEQDGLAIKPDPDMINHVLDALEIKPKDAIFIGDSEVDILTGKNAKLPVIAVTWGFRTKNELIKYQPEYIIDNVIDMLDIIKKAL